MGNRKFQPPGVKRLQVFMDNFKSDFECLNPPRRTQEITFRFGALNDQGSSQIQEFTQPESTSVESPLTPTNISNPATVDSSQQPIIVHAPDLESPASMSSASSSSSISHVIPVPSGDTVDSCTTTVGGATLPVAVAYPSPPETEDGGPNASDAEDGTKSKEIDEAEDIASDIDDGGPDAPETSTSEEDSKSEETNEAEDTENDDDTPQHRKYEFHHCQTVIMNAFNARGVKAKNCGNNAPQVIYHDAPSSSKSSSSSYDADLGQLSRYQVVLPNFTRRNLPPIIPPLSFQKSEDNSESLHPLTIQSAPPGTPPIMNTLRHSINMDLHPSFLLSPFPGAVQDTLSNKNTADILSSQPNPHSRHDLVESPIAINPSAQDFPDSDSMFLEHQLQSVLDTVLIIRKKLKSSGISSSADILTPRTQRILGAVNALVSTEPPVSSPRAGWRSLHSYPGCESLSSHS